MTPALPHVASLPHRLAHVPDALSRVAGFLAVSVLVLSLTLAGLVVVLTAELAGVSHTSHFTAPMILTGLTAAAAALVVLQYAARATAHRWKTRLGTTADPDTDAALATENQIFRYAALSPVAIALYGGGLLSIGGPLLPTALILAGTVLFLLGMLHALALALPSRPE